MADWREELTMALRAGDAEHMRAIPARVPQHVIDQAASMIDTMATAAQPHEDPARTLIRLNAIDIRRHRPGDDRDVSALAAPLR